MKTIKLLSIASIVLVPDLLYQNIKASQKLSLMTVSPDSSKLSILTYTVKEKLCIEVDQTKKRIGFKCIQAISSLTLTAEPASSLFEEVFSLVGNDWV